MQLKLSKVLDADKARSEEKDHARELFKSCSDDVEAVPLIRLTTRAQKIAQYAHHCMQILI